MFGMNEACAVKVSAPSVKGRPLMPGEATDTPSPPRSLVEGLVVHLRDRVAFAHELQSVTENRLENILQPVAGANGAEGKGEKENACALANELGFIIRAVEALIARKQAMLERVQV